MKAHEQNIRFSIAREISDRQKYFTIRHDAYAENSLIPEDSGTESEADEAATIIVAKHGDQVVGGARLIVASAFEDLPFTELLPHESREDVATLVGADCCAEYGATALLPEYRNGMVILAMHLHCEAVARELGLRKVFYWTDRVRARMNRIAFKTAYKSFPDCRIEFAEVCEFTATKPQWQIVGKLTLGLLTVLDHEAA